MTERIHESPEFTGLSHFMSKLAERTTNTDSLTKGQTLRLKSLILQIINQIMKNIESNGEQSTQSSNLNFVLSAISLYIKQNISSELEAQVAKLEEENANLKNGMLDDQQDVIANAESALISRLVENIQSSKPISSEDELANLIEHKMDKYGKLVSGIITSFDLPESTKGSQIVSTLEAKLKGSKGNDFKAKKEVTEVDLNATFREELLKTTNQLLAVQKELENLKKTIENKNEHIRRLRDERNLVKQQLKEALSGLDEKSKQPTENNEIFSAQVESIKAELLTAQIDIDKKSRKIEKQRIYMKKIEDRLNDYQEQNNALETENKIANEQISNLKENLAHESPRPKRKIDVNDNEIMDLKKRIEKKENDLQNYQKIFEDLAQQFDQQNEELAEESRSRNTLVSSVQKLGEINQIWESQIDTANTKIESLSRQLDEALNKIEEHEQQPRSPRSFHQNLDLTYLRSIQRLSEEVLPDCAKQINDISDDEAVSAPQRVLHLFSFVIESFKRQKLVRGSLNESEELKKEKALSARLYSAAVSQLHFIEELVNSRDIQVWVIGDDKIEESRSRLQTQCARMESFIAENCAGMVHESDLFNYLMIHSDPLTLSAHVAEFVDSYKDLQTSEGKELFLMLLQALTANDVLQKFATEARTHYEKQYDELRNLREAFEDQNDNSESGPKIKKGKISDDGIYELLDNIRSNVRSAIGSGKDLQTLLRCLEKVDEVKIDSNKYLRKIERKLSQEISESQKLKSKLDSIASDANNELSMLKKEMTKLNSEYAQKSAEVENKTKEMQNEINEKEQTISKLQHELGMSASQFDNLLKEKSTKTVSEKSAELQREFEETRQQYEDIVKELRDEVTEMQERVKISEQETKGTIASIKSKENKKKAKLVNAVKCYQEKLEKATIENAAVVSDLTKKLEASRNAEETATKEVQRCTDEISDLKSKVSSLSVEHKMMNTRLISKDEKLKREKALFESQLKLKLFALDSESKTKIEAMKNELVAKNQDFLSRICRMFREMVDINMTVDEDTVEQVLSKVRSRLTTLDKESFAADEAINELEAIKTSLGPIKYIKISTAVGEIMDRNKQLEADFKRIDAENISYKKDVQDARTILLQNTNNKEWEDWARKLHSLVSDGFCSVKSPKEIRNAVEEVVFAAIGNKIVWRRLDCLRAEKKLILRGVMRIKPKSGPPSLRQLMTISIVIGRLQKLSGHFQSSLSLHRREGINRQNSVIDTESVSSSSKASAKEIKRPPVKSGQPPRTPLFSKFVVQPTHSAINVDD